MERRISAGARQDWRQLMMRYDRQTSNNNCETHWSGGPGFDPRYGRPLPTGWVGVSIMWPAETEVMVSPLCLVCGSTYCQTPSLGSRPRYSLVADDDFKKPTTLKNYYSLWPCVIRQNCHQNASHASLLTRPRHSLASRMESMHFTC